MDRQARPASVQCSEELQAEWSKPDQEPLVTTYEAPPSSLPGGLPGAWWGPRTPSPAQREQDPSRLSVQVGYAQLSVKGSASRLLE